MRLLRLLIALLCVAVGVAIGALNPQRVVLDLGFAALPSTLGIIVLATLLVGAVTGGLVLAVSVVLPLRQQLRRMRLPPPQPPDVR